MTHFEHFLFYVSLRANSSYSNHKFLRIFPLNNLHHVRPKSNFCFLIIFNTLFELDFKSCEPNFYLRSHGLIGEEIEDVYVHIGKLVGLDVNKERGKVKRTILSILYGANEDTAKRIGRITKDKIRKIKFICFISLFCNTLFLCPLYSVSSKLRII